MGKCLRAKIAPEADPGMRPRLLVWLGWHSLVLRNELKDWEQS